MTAVDAHSVRHFRQILLWPLQLVADPSDNGGVTPWQRLEATDELLVWRCLADEFTADPRDFQERHYKEFVAFLPYVQRFLYGESRSARATPSAAELGESALKVYRRHDVAALRVILRAGEPPLTLRIAHIDLYFFDDTDIVLLNVELAADDLPLVVARDLMYRFGRVYPTGWDEHGDGVHNVWRAEWLDADERVLTTSDSADSAKFLEAACRFRAAGTTAHWAYLVEPLVPDASAASGRLRYRQVAYHRMPLMAYLAIDNPRTVPADDWIRLGLIATLHPDEPIPRGDPDVQQFNERYVFDRYWSGTESGPNTRFLCSGRALIVIGDARSSYFRNDERGILSQFRHQYFMLFLIAHFHQAALLAFSERLVDAIHDLDIRQSRSVLRFRARIHAGFESFLRFTHRYWFSTLSEHPHMQALHRACVRYLGNATMYEEVKDELRDMSQYLDSDVQRRQTTTVTRLTVVTVFSLIGTVATGFLGMNIIDETQAPLWQKVAYFALTAAAAAALTLVTVMKSRWLSEIMDTLSDDQLPIRSRVPRLSLGRARREPLSRDG